MHTSCLRLDCCCFVIGLMLFSLACALNAQEPVPPSNGDSETSPAEDFSIRIGVEEVRLDVVVVDGKGRQITGLTADDFEIYQDGKPQTITGARYISTQKEFRASPGPGSSHALLRQDVRRTIVFIVDNLGMQFEHIYRAKMAIRKFVETQMLPGDLVAIVPTAGGNAAMQTFSSEKKELFAMAENVQWLLDARTTRTTPQLLAYSYCIRALQEMPGRKYLLLITAQPDSPPNKVQNVSMEYVRMRVRAAGLPDEGPLSTMFMQAYRNYLSDPNPGYAAYFAAVNRIADGALRAGVVIHSLDIKGVEAEAGIDTSTTRSPLPKKTGGLYVTSNFFTQGIGEVNEWMKGYYLLSYIPPAGTFRQSKDLFHRMKIKAKTPGSTVHAREGFYAGSKEREGSAAQKGDPLLAAMLSPFRNGDLAVSLSSGYIDDPQKGYLLQAFLHLNAGGIQIVDQKDGRYSISLEVVGTILDINGDIHDSGRVQQEISVDDRELLWIKEHGIRCSLTIPSKRPGSYYVRVAVRDKASGKIGSAYRFIEIPDLKKGELALSSIFILNPAASEPAKPGDFQDPIDVGRIMRPGQVSFHAGETLHYTAFVYNAKGTKPDLESQFILFRDGEEVHRGEPESVDLTSAGDLRKISLQKAMRLDNTMEPGNYTLQLVVKNKQPGKNGSLAAQTLDFEISAK